MGDCSCNQIKEVRKEGMWKVHTSNRVTTLYSKLNMKNEYTLVPGNAKINYKHVHVLWNHEEQLAETQYRYTQAHKSGGHRTSDKIRLQPKSP